jgi:hypothetical protein
MSASGFTFTSASRHRNTRLKAAIIHRVESSARRFRQPACFWERAASKASRAESKTTKDNAGKQCATARKTDERNMNAHDYTLQSVMLLGCDFASDEVFAEHTSGFEKQPGRALKSS